MMDFTQLRTFVTVAREGSITRASEILYRSQPTISVQVKCMEEMLGFSLFERTSRGMEVTYQGQKLMEEANEILLRHQRLLENAKVLRGQIGGRVSLGVGPGVSNRRISDFLVGLSVQVPNITVDITRQSSCAVRQGIRAGEFDAGLYVAGMKPHDNISTTDICDINLHVAAATGTDPAAIEALPWILPSAGSFRARVAEEYATARGLQPARHLTINDERLYSELLARGLGIGFCYVTEDDENAGIVSLEIVDCSMRLQFAHSPARIADPMLTVLRDLLLPAEVPQPVAA